MKPVVVGISIGGNEVYNVFTQGIGQEGTNFVAGAHFFPMRVRGDIPTYSSTMTPRTSYGAVIEQLRVSGIVKWLQFSTSKFGSSNKKQLSSQACGYMSFHTSGYSYVKLPTSARKYQEYEVTSVHNAHVRVYSGFTSGTQNLPDQHNDNRDLGSNANKIYYQNTYHSYIDVHAYQTQRFVWTGARWKRMSYDEGFS